MTDRDPPSRPGFFRSSAAASRASSSSTPQRLASNTSARPQTGSQQSVASQRHHPQAAQSQLREQQGPSTPSQPQPQPQRSTPFHPLFILVTTTSARGTITHHPNVHYIFSDDDPDDLTQALAQHHAPSSPVADAQDDDPSAPGSGASSRHSTGGAPPPTRRGGVHDRAMVVDLVPRGDESGALDVAWASSLSGEWAVVGTRIGRVDGGDDNGAGAEGGEGGPGRDQMLRIEGVEADLGVASSAAGTAGSGRADEGEMHGSGARVQGEDYAALIEEFDRRMKALERVVETGEERQRRIAADEEAEAETARAEEEGQQPVAEDDGGGQKGPTGGD